MKRLLYGVLLAASILVVAAECRRSRMLTDLRRLAGPVTTYAEANPMLCGICGGQQTPRLTHCTCTGGGPAFHTAACIAQAVKERDLMGPPASGLWWLGHPPKEEET